MLEDNSEDDNLDDSKDKGKIKKCLNKISLFRAWQKLDHKLMKPLLTNSRPPLTETMPEFCLPFSKLFTSKEQV